MSENAIEDFLVNVVAICNQEESVPFICVIGKQLEGSTALGAIGLDHLKDEDIISVFKQMIHNYYSGNPEYRPCEMCDCGYRERSLTEKEEDGYYDMPNL